MSGEVDLERRLLDECRAGFSLSLGRLQNMFGRHTSLYAFRHPTSSFCLLSQKTSHLAAFRFDAPTMRLLQRNNDGRYTLTEFVGDTIPHYAILSHTWGADHDEVTLADMEKDTAMTKAGYKKLQFCADQAAKDHLRYFWVDTCCIDKTSSAELTEAINSMFKWYRKATQCYAYLSDVSTGGLSSGKPVRQDWYPAFERSRWFTRGWTLQELVAPTSVEFFSVEGERLGHKHTLVQELHRITGISVEALQGTPLDQFGVDERMSWVETRQTKREEDMVYSLLGIFEVYMPLIYGEGRGNALARLLKEINARPIGELSLPQNIASQHQSQAAQSYNGAVFNRSILGHHAVSENHFTRGTNNFNFGCRLIQGRCAAHLT
jgi:hypothetical protein